MRSGAIQRDVREALLDAIRRAWEMEIVVSDAEIGETFANYLAVPATTYEAALFQLLDHVEAQNKLVLFLLAAGARNPENDKLRQVLAHLFDLDARFAALRPDKSLGEAERIVLKGLTFEDVAVWIASLAKMRHAVCRVEPQPEKESLDGFGTGFLVAPDVVMTNFHVAEGFWDDKSKAGRAVLRFDYEKGASGVAVQSGATCRLATKLRGPAVPSKAQAARPWQVLASPESDLDFALLRLDRLAGDDTVDGGNRGFLRLTARGFNPTDPILILQHPNADPLKLSFGAVVKLDPPNRVLYQVNTEPGSSGSPCLTQDLKVTAIHHYGLRTRNRGVPCEAILPFLATKQGSLTALGLGQLLS
jgi:hypothetical protein